MLSKKFVNDFSWKIETPRWILGEAKDIIGICFSASLDNMEVLEPCNGKVADAEKEIFFTSRKNIHSQ